MLDSMLYALVPVLLGVAFALVAERFARALSFARTAALAAALMVVFGTLLPSAARELGGVALVIFGVGLIGPSILERVFVRRGGGEHGLPIELAYWGLALHQLGDGLALGGAAHVEHGDAVMLGVAAHTAPLVAVAVLGYAAHDGVASALRRSAGLLVASALGVILGGSLAWQAGESLEPILRAGLAGCFCTSSATACGTTPRRRAGAGAGSARRGDRRGPAAARGAGRRGAWAQRALGPGVLGAVCGGRPGPAPRLWPGGPDSERGDPRAHTAGCMAARCGPRRRGAR
ncbi:MAG: hypothetical protein IPI35_34355 [Deltaproteobacteria bacterium]|nr:hypothetical protein [Deltaproteobacteria bacterium]